MKNIFITQGVYKDKNNTIYTRLDYDWYKYANKMKFSIFPIPYNEKMNFFNLSKVDGIIFSGGNDLYSKKKNKVNLIRDNYEKKIFYKIINKKIPKMFICRGMQLLANIYNIKIHKTDGHVKKNHMIEIKGRKINVNSFHNYKIFKNPKKFKTLALHNDGSIEMMEYKQKLILSMMFHPERKSISQNKVDLIFKNFFKI